MKRRAFLGSIGTGAVGLGTSSTGGLGENRGSAAAEMQAGSSPLLDLSALPNFCGHEHWGSIDSIGMVPEGFRADVERGATPKRQTGLFDILLDPYFRGFLVDSGTTPNDVAKASGITNFESLALQSPVEALRLLRPILARQELTGTYQCTRRGLLALYGVDISSGESNSISQLGNAIERNYQEIFDWYRTAMRKARFTELIRIVHPEYYVRQESPQTAAQDSALTHTLMRIDPLMELWKNDSPRRVGLARIAGIEPHDAATWRAFISNLCDLAGSHKAGGIKQLQAYTRSLEYIPRTDSEVVWRGDLSANQVRVFQDWVMHECCKQANDRNWVHQVHVGTNNITESSPMPLGPLAQRYPRMKIVMLHCWPFLREAGWLAKFHPNIYITTCWQPVLNPNFFFESMMSWLNYVPLHKLTCDHDSTSVEMAVGSSLFTREILAEVLPQTARHTGLTKRSLQGIALDMLHNNMVEIYGIGRRIPVERLENWPSWYESSS